MTAVGDCRRCGRSGCCRGGAVLRAEEKEEAIRRACRHGRGCDGDGGGRDRSLQRRRPRRRKRRRPADGDGLSAHQARRAENRSAGGRVLRGCGLL